MKEYATYDALGLAGLVASGQVSAEELLDDAVARVEARNPELNAINFKVYDYAKQRIARGLPKGPFTGVPFLVKDLGPTFAGMPHSKGCRALVDEVAPLDSELATRYLKSGVVPFAKTNAPEFGLMGVTEPVLFGPTKTPWDLSRTSGGSSGGSASGVAAGIAPIASAGDGGGSIRIPAACCGLFGLKPTRGRTPHSPEGEGWQGAVVEHILSRSVRDSAAMLDFISGPGFGAPFHIMPPGGTFLEAVSQAPKPLKIGYTIDSPIGTGVDAACIAAVEFATKLLESLGHHVEQAKPIYDGELLARSYFTLYFGEVAAELKALRTQLGKRITRNDVEIATRTLGLLGNTFTAGEFAAARKNWNIFSQAMAKFHQKYDIYLTPTMAVAPPLIGANDPSFFEQLLMQAINILGAGSVLKATGVVNQLAIKNMSKTPFTQLANLTGQPAMNVPLFWSDDNLPIGVQCIGPTGNERLLYQLAGQLEVATSWAQRRPPCWDL